MSDPTNDNATAPAAPPPLTVVLQQEIDSLCAQFGALVRNREVVAEESERQLRDLDSQIDNMRRVMTTTATTLNEMKKRGHK